MSDGMHNASESNVPEERFPVSTRRKYPTLIYRVSQAESKPISPMLPLRYGARSDLDWVRAPHRSTWMTAAMRGMPATNQRTQADKGDMNDADDVVKSPSGWRRFVLLMGSIGPLGHLPASGTVTVAVVGIPLYYWMHDWSRGQHIAAVSVFTLASVWLHDAGDRWLNEKDSRKLVWDELVGYLIAVAPLAAFSWPLAITAFLIERVIDIVKVPPARWIERRWPGGWGVVGDDVVAGLYTCFIMLALRAIVPTVFGAA